MVKSGKFQFGFLGLSDLCSMLVPRTSFKSMLRILQQSEDIDCGS